MRVWFLTLLSALSLCALATSGAIADPPVGRVLSVKVGGEGSATRVVVESDIALKYHVFVLAAGTHRVVIDLPRVRWSINGLTSESGSGKGSGLVAGYRYAQNTATTSRLVLDLAKPALVTREFVLAPKTKDERHRIVLDLDAATTAAFVEAATGENTGPQPVAQQIARKPLIVIDPGHGGKDPGASSSKGVREKDVVLAAAKALRDELLVSQRYDVALTRSTDVFIELEDRVTKARNLGADLFIALHADAGGKPGTSGASVYTLSPEGEKRVDGARRQNDWILDVEVDSTRPEVVNQILADLVQRETKNQSARFAQILAASIGEHGWPTLQNTHRKKGLYVLLSPDVPAALLEMGFITNEDDVAAMTSETKRKKLVQGVAHAIDQFFDSQTRMVAAR
ncbi:MAG TPA: N-acetylmuramoyl-L-alanine amidase [Hyphomonadaceae bacterium]|nr:N-acetylmuramoyl-L-alanine amidase [Hyphomonadaceae bacterium]